MRVRALLLPVSTMFVAACGHLPDVTVGYYLAETKVSFKVVRSVACDGANMPFVANAAVPIAAHSADRTRPLKIRLADLRGLFSDSDVKFEFYDDGRLKGINASSTGQGETIFKAAVTLAATMKTLTTRDFQTECDFIKTAGGGKPLTLTYEGLVDIANTTTDQPIKPDTASTFYADKLKQAVGDVCAVVQGTEIPDPPTAYAARDGDAVIQARHPGFVKIKVKAGGGGCIDQVWEGKVPVAQIGKSYSLPIPAPAMFGKQAFAAAFQESGALVSLQYASSTGAGQVLNVLNSAVTGLHETTAQKAAEIKAEADLIAQQQRLAQCLADRQGCK